MEKHIESLMPSARIVWDYLVISDPPEKADAIFVFGSQNPQVPIHAAKLFKKNLANKILVSGNSPLLKEALSAEPEAITFSRKMLELGIPEEAIILETAARHTGDNVALGMAKLMGSGLTIKHLLLVAKPPHMRRCVATFAKQFPDIRVSACPPPLEMRHLFEDSLTVRPNENPLLRLAEEVERLKKYSEMGYIQHVEIPTPVQASADLIISDLRIPKKN